MFVIVIGTHTHGKLKKKEKKSITKDQHVPKYNLFDCLLKLNDLLSVGE